MKYVYILKSIHFSHKHYVGSTNDLKRRFKEHNTGKVVHTNEFRPWRLSSYFAFSDPIKANKFEASKSFAFIADLPISDL